MVKKLWGGRFSKKTDSLVEEFTSSINIDKELAFYDVVGSILHVTVLKEARLISLSEYQKISKGLFEILNEISSGKFIADKSSEDIHSDIQAKLERRIGPVAFKLHTARSRNEQIVFDVKFYCKEQALKTANSLIDLINSIKRLLTENKNIIIPGYTHLQHAQPVSLENYFGAYCQMLSRDFERMIDLSKKIKLFLGSGALAGTPIEASAYEKAIRQVHSRLRLTDKILVKGNSLDNVSDRDFVIEGLSYLAIIGMHLSRLAEDLIIWSTTEFGFIELDDAFCTGSSLMPQKKNPDVLELIRANTAKLYGNLVSVLTMMKGLPLAYNRDMQLDKEPLFNSFNTVKGELKILTKLIPTIKFNKDKISRQLQDESLYATDIAHYLVERGVSFRDAHRIIGNLVKFSLDKKIKIKEMDNEQLQKFSRFLTVDIIKKLIDPRYSVALKKSIT